MTNPQTYYIIDFDSTFIQVEAMDELANISLQDYPNKEEILQQIKDITDLGMTGKMAFDETLRKRIILLEANKNHVEQLIKVLQTKVTTSFIRHQNFLSTHAENIYIVSGGFKEYILPVVTQYGIQASHVFGNDFLYNDEQKIIGYDTNNLLSQVNGKVKWLQQLQLQGNIIVIGDGYTDYQLKESGLANTFYLFTENVKREILIQYADQVIASMDDLFNS